MKLTLYKMWLRYCKRYGYYPMGEDATVKLDSKNIPKITGGKVSFNGKTKTYVKYPSQEYDAWRAFKLAIQPYNIVIFILSTYAVFKKNFPATSIWFDLNRYNAKKILLEVKKRPFMLVNKYAGLYNALGSDAQSLRHVMR